MASSSSSGAYSPCSISSRSTRACIPEAAAEPAADSSEFIMGAAGMKMPAAPSCRKAPFGIPGSLPGPARSNPRSGCRKVSKRIPTASHAPALHQASADQQMAIRVDTLLICPGPEYRFRQFHFSFSRVPLYQAKQPVGVDFWIHGFRIWLNQSAERRNAEEAP